MIVLSSFSCQRLWRLDRAGALHLPISGNCVILGEAGGACPNLIEAQAPVLKSLTKKTLPKSLGLRARQSFRGSRRRSLFLCCPKIG